MTRFDDQVLRRFLAAAAVAFALGGDPSSVAATAAGLSAPAGERGDVGGAQADVDDDGADEGGRYGEHG